jgi:hypothetical protein
MFPRRGDGFCFVPISNITRSDCWPSFAIVAKQGARFGVCSLGKQTPTIIQMEGQRRKINQSEKGRLLRWPNTNIKKRSDSLISKSTQRKRAGVHWSSWGNEHTQRERTGWGAVRGCSHSAPSNCCCLKVVVTITAGIVSGRTDSSDISILHFLFIPCQSWSPGRGLRSLVVPRLV